MLAVYILQSMCIKYVQIHGCQRLPETGSFTHQSEVEFLLYKGDSYIINQT